MANHHSIIWVLGVSLTSLLVVALLAGGMAVVQAHPALTAADVLRHTAAQIDDQPTTVMTDSTQITNALYFPLIQSPAILYLPLAHLPNSLLPSVPYPAQNASGQSPNAFLQWTTLEPAAAQLRYDLYLEANNPQPTTLVAQGLQKANFDSTTFEVDTQYYWRVVVSDEQGQQVTGPVWSFRVEPNFDPAMLGTMVKVPAGEFLMGCDRAVENCFEPNALPLHRVYLDGFEIDKYEVTNREYRACVESKVCPRPRRSDSPTRSSYFTNPAYDNYPVMYVSWWNATDYCTWVGKRLPTEAEWEKAARGPIDTRQWPWGNEGADCSRANYRTKCVGDTEQVGSHPSGASPYGAMDMTGSMFEWVLDRYDYYYYRNSPYANPQGPRTSRPNPEKPGTSHPYFVIRSGSYHDNWFYSRITHRHWGHHGDRPGEDAPNYRSFRVGIRCARSLPE
jgi:formylglycine-generating enzyme required for sulfatase activity